MHISKSIMKYAVIAATILSAFVANADSHERSNTACNQRKEVGMLDNSNGKLVEKAPAAKQLTKEESRSMHGRR
jgi:hypothetical protein